MDQIIAFILLGFPASYVLMVMLLTKKRGFEGPFKDWSRTIYFPAEYDESAHTQPVALFDWARRLFGAYRISDRIWFVRGGSLGEVWRCPKCLGFWTALPFSVVYCIEFVSEPIWFWFPVGHLTIVASSLFILKVIEWDS